MFPTLYVIHIYNMTPGADFFVDSFLKLIFAIVYYSKCFSIASVFELTILCTVIGLSSM